jgi:GDPmannose 4,6-dehydratase
MKTYVISGISGQCGSILAEKLLNEGQTVIGIIRRTSDEYKWRISHLLNNKNLILCSGDITDQNSIDSIIKERKPDYFINTAAQSHVGVSFKQPILTAEVTGLGVVKCLESIRKYAPSCRFLQFSTSEMFGATNEIPQSETTPFDACSPYAASKIFAFYMTKYYAEAYNMFCSNMILFNTESEKRGLNFVTRKITNAVAKIYLGLQNRLVLWDLSPKRDWLYTRDSMDGALKILHHHSPDTFVISSGKTHTVKAFCEAAFSCVNLSWQNYVIVDKSKARIRDVPILCGNNTKAKQILGWEPTTSFNELIDIMVEDDIRKIKNGQHY